MNLGALSGLSATYPGYLKGKLEGDKADLADFQVDDARRQALAKVAMGNALALIGGGGGGQPNQGLPAPPPGQQSQPMGPPGGQPPQMGMQAPPQAPTGMPMRPPGPPMMAPGQGPTMGGAPGGGGQPPVAMGPQGPQGLPQRGQGQLNWQSLVQAVKQANPDIKPDVMAEAVNQFMPLMNQQSQQEWRNVSLQLREQALQQREHDLLILEQGRNQRAGAAEEGRESRSERSDTRMRDKSTEQTRQFEKREQRLGESLKFREDSTWQRLEQQKQQAEQRVQQSQGKQGLAELRAIIDAQDKHVRTRIQAFSSTNTMDQKEKKAMLDQADKDYDEQIKQLKEKYGHSSTGTKPAGDTSPKTTDRVTPGSPNPADDAPPPEAIKQLKEGTVTTFGNGQKWTLKNGKPERVP